MDDHSRFKCYIVCLYPQNKLMYTDTHTHLYLEAFSSDRDDMIRRALDAGVSRMLLPNIDSSTEGAMLSLAGQYPGSCFPMAGLHPTSVKENWRDELKVTESLLQHQGIIAVGETGIDLYWDRTYIPQQVEAFKIQIDWAKEMDLPIVIHSRNSFREVFKAMDEAGTDNLRGVFHSFSGTGEELEKALSYGFMIGINGIVTYKNSNLREVVRAIPVDRLLLETDAPFLTPVPHRGQRNESSYLVEIAAVAGEIHNLTKEKVGEITTRNADKLFFKKM